ncbi:hypothetical protein E2C01_090851 [Portunus trituberculatus]|uniref:Uncharacterized protein n=1 Tax=Portunus trituberculatus TaxID=210409 RepID=A0A5B7JHQ9_PORTR|nr:hypothetical protein [Portunus trituberculatus]
MKRDHPLVLPELQPLDVTSEDFARLQECPSLLNLRNKLTQMKRSGQRTALLCYLRCSGRLYRKRLPSKRPAKVGKLTLVPKDCRLIILSVGHEKLRSFLSCKDFLEGSSHFWDGHGYYRLLSIL